MARRNSTTRRTTSSGGSSTTSFCPVVRLITVSGVTSIDSMRSALSLDRLNEVRIEHQRPMVEAREVDHETSILIGRAGRSRRGFQQKAELPAGLYDPAAEPQLAVEQTVHRAAHGKVEGHHVAFGQAQ